MLCFPHFTKKVRLGIRTQVKLQGGRREATGKLSGGFFFCLQFPWWPGRGAKSPPDSSLKLAGSELVWATLQVVLRVSPQPLPFCAVCCALLSEGSCMPKPTQNTSTVSLKTLSTQKNISQDKRRMLCFPHFTKKVRLGIRTQVKFKGGRRKATEKLLVLFCCLQLLGGLGVGPKARRIFPLNLPVLNSFRPPFRWFYESPPQPLPLCAVCCALLSEGSSMSRRVPC